MQYLYLPRFGQIMEQGTIVAWHVKEGDSFDTGDVLYEVETEKTVVAYEATFSGTVARLLVAEGDEVPVGTVLAVCWEPGETPDPQRLEAAIREVRGQGTAPAAEKRPQISPRARRLAEQHGLDYTAIQGTGPGGIITEADIRRALDEAGSQAGDEKEEPGQVPATVIKQTPVQRAMARAMGRSWAEIPQFVQSKRFNAAKLLELRGRLNDSGGAANLRVTLTDLIVYLAARVVARHPLVNATYRDGDVITYKHVNMAIAVETEAGLVTPVLKNAETLSLQETVAGIRELVDRAQRGSLTPGDTQGGTISLSNLGMLGVEWGTPIINPPQSCVIFVGALHDRLLLIDGTPKAVPAITLSIAFDHRVLDGATAARFTSALCEALEEPVVPIA